MSHAFPKLRPLLIAYVLWIWWATLYLSHHYAVDLVAGSLREFIASVHMYVTNMINQKN
jgi:inositol phosphorylceramide synthase catalytic subunit